MNIGQVGPQGPASAIVGGSTLPSTPTARQVFCKTSGGSTGMYVCVTNGAWVGPFSTGGGISGLTTNTVPKATSATTIGDSAVSDNGTNVLSTEPIAIGFGTTTPTSGPMLSVASTISTSPRGIASMQFSTDTAGARLGFFKARGTVAAPTTVVTGDTLGRLMFRGYDGSNYLEMGSIESVSTGTIAATRIPTQLVFSTATDAAPSVLTTALTLGADQSATFAGPTTYSGATNTFTNGITLGTSGNLFGGTNLVEQRNGVNAQTFRFYNTFTDTSNYERGFARWSANVFQVGNEVAGTGSNRNLQLTASGSVTFAAGGTTTQWFVTSAGGHFQALTDNTYDIGATNASRARRLYLGTGLSIEATITAAGTTGAQTINKTAGAVNFAATATSLVVTNSTVTASSIVICTVQTNDATLKSVQCVPTANSFTIFANAAATAETRIGFLVVEPD